MEITGSPACELGARRCTADLEECVTVGEGRVWRVIEPCANVGKLCDPTSLGCKNCLPLTTRCDGQNLERCDASGTAFSFERACDANPGVACRPGGCVHLCGAAADERSNVGCEYWAVDLDNANVDTARNAAAQQFAVVVSNPQPDVPARVTVARDDTAVDEPGAPIDVASVTVPPLSLRVFKLGPREVDGSKEGEFNTGSHTAHTRGAYRVTSDIPIIAYQFNPLENVNVFSNDASLLKPVEALNDNPGVMSTRYVAIGWPQTIASTEDPYTNFNPNDPIDLRAFLAVVATRDSTKVRVRTRTRIHPGGPVPATEPGEVVELSLNAFDVLNLETNTFGGDFTGSVIEADQPVVVFSGGEASDAPFFDTLASRRCCADHLEEQLDPLRTAGRQFVAARTSSRSRAVAAAGAKIGVLDEPEFYRVVAVSEGTTEVTTTLSGDDQRFTLTGRGDFVDIRTTRDFMVETSEPVVFGHVTASQAAAGVPRGLPGGDPSFLVVPPLEQFRRQYVFLTPDKYAFDFIRVIAPPGTAIVLDGQPIAGNPGCSTAPADGLTEDERGSPTAPWVVHRCQLSFPKIDPDAPSGSNLSPGAQNDGVHRLEADQRVGVLVDGFDSFVSYGYAAGTELREITPK